MNGVDCSGHTVELIRDTPIGYGVTDIRLQVTRKADYVPTTEWTMQLYRHKNRQQNRFQQSSL